MEARFRIYLEDEDKKVYCFNCAMLSVMQLKGKNFNLGGKDYSFDGCDLRSTPKCSVCGRDLGEGILL